MKRNEYSFGELLPRMARILTSQRAFTLWVGYGVPPFLFGMVVVAWFQSLWFGLVTAMVVGAWCAYTLNTTCRRCPFFGTSKCPVPGRIGSLFLSPKSLDSVSIKQVRIHYYVDLAMISFANFVYFFCPPLFPVVVLGTIGALVIVYIPKKHHGLLFKLR